LGYLEAEAKQGECDSNSNGKSKSNGNNSRSPSGMTTRKATATAKTTFFGVAIRKAKAEGCVSMFDAVRLGWRSVDGFG
jgi:hypothetical protein